MIVLFGSVGFFFTFDIEKPGEWRKGLTTRLRLYMKLDHVPGSCIVVMVHVRVVKGRQYSTYTVPHAGASIARNGV
jgi:hypothetical protein